MEEATSFILIALIGLAAIAAVLLFSGS